MRFLRHAVLWLTTPAFVVLLAVGCLEQPVEPSLSALPSPKPSFVQAAQTTGTDRHVVDMSDGIPGDFSARVQALGGTVAASYPDIGVVVTKGLSDTAASQLAAAPGIAGIDRDVSVQWIPSPSQVPVQALQVASDRTNQSGAFFYSFYQWNLRQIGADAAWLTTNQGAGTRVAILDTGIDPTHIDLAGKIDLANSASMLTSSACGASDITTINDFHYHGTFVAGIVASNGIGIASVAPDAQIIAVKVLDCAGHGDFTDIIAGIVYATNAGADVINMSLGAYFAKNLPDSRHLVAALNRATNYANSHGSLVIAAAGNDAVNLNKDKNFVSVPAQSANVISVGATGPFQQANFDNLAPYTDFGTSGVSLMAPGGNLQTGGDPFGRDGIFSTCSSFSLYFSCAGGIWYLIGDGTSFAAPHVAATAAVVKSQLPGMNPAQLEHCLYQGAADLGKVGVDQLYSHGRIDVLKAAQC